jgi:hypothetical protein
MADPKRYNWPQGGPLVEQKFIKRFISFGVVE